jgi:cell division protein FtsI (penicillin-binding protein 3)
MFLQNLLRKDKMPRPPQTQSLERKRLLFLSLFIFLLFSILIIQFYHIQIIEGDKWSKVADRQHYFVVNEPFIRGTFISNTAINKGHPEAPQSFVFDVQKFHLYADPLSIPPEYRLELVNHLSTILGSETTNPDVLMTHLSKKSHSRKLAMWLDKERHDAVLSWWTPFAKQYKIPRNALFFMSDYQRSYPFGKLLGQVLHTIQNVKDEATSQALPTGGLELYFNKYLKGTQGKRLLMRSPRNSLETGDVISQPQHGANIHLTINHCLQAILEDEIEKGVKNSKAKSGWAAMMNPYTGEILALAQYPFFFPEDYQRYFNDPTLIEHTKVKALTDANEPGSIMKPITLAVALKANAELLRRNEEPLFDPEEMMPTSNSQFFGRKKPLKDTHFHSFLNMNMALQKSSNIYMARLVEKIIQRLGKEWYREVLQEDFGLGRKTGLELPSESPGLLPRIGVKHPNGTYEWSVSTPYSMAMGHNIQVNSLQVLRAYAIFANGGYLVNPTLVRKIVQTFPDDSKEVLIDNTLHHPRHFVMNEKDTKRILTAMKYTTKFGGTAKRADVWGYTEAGKTGTADKVVHGAYDPHFVCSSFVGIVPVNDPAFVLIVAIDEPEYGYEPGVGRKHMGGICAAPVFKDIAQRSLEYLGIAPDDPYGYPVGDPRYDSQKADWLPEIRQLQEKYEKWNKDGGK